jgi:hypothetical protein
MCCVPPPPPTSYSHLQGGGFWKRLALMLKLGWDPRSGLRSKSYPLELTWSNPCSTVKENDIHIQTIEYIGGRDKIVGVFLPSRWSVYCNCYLMANITPSLVLKYSERGWACTLHHISIMMECTPESVLCHSVCMHCVLCDSDIQRKTVPQWTNSRRAHNWLLKKYLISH